MRLSQRTLSHLASLSLTLAAALALGCGGGSGTGDPCSGSESRCVGGDFQVCDGSNFEVQESCAGTTVCDPTLGCSECSPVGGTYCNGDTVVSCRDDGTIGGDIETCDPGECSSGTCGGLPVDCDATGVELIYVVTAEPATLLSFDPLKLGTASDPFTSIGSLNCPAGKDIRDPFGIEDSTPFSMSVDRDGTAWVLYSSGEIFHVSTEDASCQATSFSVGQAGFQLFGMGFVSDAPGSAAETLYIAGGSAMTSTAQDLGSIDTNTMGVSMLGTLPTAQFGPELTGTGNAELFGFYPGQTTFVAQMDKASGGSTQTYPLGMGGTPMAWAFAHYGGNFYIFVQYGGAPQVIELDPNTGIDTTVIPNSPHQVVGAGVSTCAPVVIE